MHNQRKYMGYDFEDARLRDQWVKRTGYFKEYEESSQEERNSQFNTALDDLRSKHKVRVAHEEFLKLHANVNQDWIEKTAFVSAGSLWLDPSEKTQFRHFL